MPVGSILELQQNVGNVVSWFEIQESAREGRILPWNGECKHPPSELLEF